jgi:hypothetical protein
MWSGNRAGGAKNKKKGDGSTGLSSSALLLETMFAEIADEEDESVASMEGTLNVLITFVNVVDAVSVS